MNYLIRKLLKEVYDTEDKPLSEKEIRLFKYVNTHKKEYNTQSKLLELFKTMMPFIGRDGVDARFYYEVYTANYRPDGDYENIDKNTFKDYRSFKQRKTPNNSAYNYSSAKIPFKGSNLEGYWDVNNKNQWYYVVESYEWYPVFLFINDQWYRVSNSYSSSTSKQMSGSNPVRWNSDLKAKVISVTPQEMKKIRDGEEIENIKTGRVKNFINNISKQVIGKNILMSIGYGENLKKVRFEITDIKEDNNKVKFFIRIIKAGNVVDGKMVVNPNGYIHPSPFSEDLEQGIKNKIISTHRDFLTDDNTEFVIQHMS